jgi:hypothetical protein
MFKNSEPYYTISLVFITPVSLSLTLSLCAYSFINNYRYDEGREVEDFVEYLKHHATKPFTLEDGSKGGPHDEL